MSSNITRKKRKELCDYVCRCVFPWGEFQARLDAWMRVGWPTRNCADVMIILLVICAIWRWVPDTRWVIAARILNVWGKRRGGLVDWCPVNAVFVLRNCFYINCVLRGGGGADLHICLRISSFCIVAFHNCQIPPSPQKRCNLIRVRTLLLTPEGPVPLKGGSNLAWDASVIPPTPKPRNVPNNLKWINNRPDSPPILCCFIL